MCVVYLIQQSTNSRAAHEPESSERLNETLE